MGSASVDNSPQMSACSIDCQVVVIKKTKRAADHIQQKLQIQTDQENYSQMIGARHFIRHITKGING
jgi:hypothetical protein